jgi:hypothetical protein
MDSQIVAFLALLGLMGGGLWLMFGKPGNRKPTDSHHDNGYGPPND